MTHDAPRKRSGATAPTDAEVASYAAARAFLAAQWFGAVLLVASFTALYVLPFAAKASTAVTYAVSLSFLVVGAFAYVQARAIYTRIGHDIAPKLHMLAAVVAGSAGIFWLLFALLLALAWMGISLLPT